MPEEQANISGEIEDKIIDLIVSGAAGRLIAFKSEADGNLVIKKRADYKGKEVRLKTIVSTDSLEGRNSETRDCRRYLYCPLFASQRN